jgi:hypothetical protein
MSGAREQVFISYSHKDKRWLDQLLEMLTPLTREGKLDAWSDRRIQPGDLWRQEIEQALARAKAAVLLVTPAFLASDFIAKEELPPLLAAAENEGLTIAWVAVRDSMYQHTPIGKYQCVNEPARPLDSLRGAQRATVLRQAAELILALVQGSAPPAPAANRAAGPAGGGAADGVGIAGAGDGPPEEAPTAPAVDRNRLFERLRALPAGLLGQLLFTLNVPPGVVRGGAAPQGERVEDLLNWAAGPDGCGLGAVARELERVVGGPAGPSPSAGAERGTAAGARPPVSAGPGFAETKRRALEQQAAALVQEYEALNRRLTTVLDPADELKIRREMEIREEKIAEIDRQLGALDAS